MNFMYFFLQRSREMFQVKFIRDYMFHGAFIFLAICLLQHEQFLMTIFTTPLSKQLMIVVFFQIKEKEQKTMQEREPGFAIAIRRKKLIASLPTIFDMILLIFQSWKRSVMTKQDLIHKLVSSHCKIVDQGIYAS